MVGFVALGVLTDITPVCSNCGLTVKRRATYADSVKSPSALQSFAGICTVSVAAPTKDEA